MSKQKKRFFQFVFVICLVIGGWSGAHFLATRSEAFTAAVTLVRQDPKVLETLGPIEDAKLSFSGYSVRYHGPNGYAEFEISLVGKKDVGTAFVNLEKSAGIWRVKKGNLILKDGKTISLQYQNLVAAVRTGLIQN